MSPRFWSIGVALLALGLTVDALPASASASAPSVVGGPIGATAATQNQAAATNKDTAGARLNTQEKLVTAQSAVDQDRALSVENGVQSAPLNASADANTNTGAGESAGKALKIQATTADILGAATANAIAEVDYAHTPLADPALEEQALKLMHNLRCLVCQNQSIADSNADMAADMRALVRERIQAGERPEVIREWLIERYGAWVSFRPPFSGITMVLWLAPLIFLLIGAAIIWRYFRKGQP